MTKTGIHREERWKGKQKESLRDDQSRSSLSHPLTSQGRIGATSRPSQSLSCSASSLFCFVPIGHLSRLLRRAHLTRETLYVSTDSDREEETKKKKKKREDKTRQEEEKRKEERETERASEKR